MGHFTDAHSLDYNTASAIIIMFALSSEQHSDTADTKDRNLQFSLWPGPRNYMIEGMIMLFLYNSSAYIHI
jgi:hypothetical protein